jgi:hypothetical protein
MSASPIWEWFAAALVHDLGKAVLNEDGFWEGHERLDEKPFGHLLPVGIVDKAKIHGDLAGLQAGLYPSEGAALIMADGLQKAMHRSDLERDERLGKSKQHPAFYPYYGRIEEGYDQARVAPIIEHLISAASRPASLSNLLRLQDELAHYPHTSYLPHLSLALHHRFSALLFYFLMRRADGGRPPSELEFSVLTVSPEPLALVYRLRDVSTHERVVNRLRSRLFREVFLQADQALLPGLAPACNPFEFFDGGSGLVLVYDRPDKIVRALQETLDEEPFIRSLQVEQTEFHLLWDWAQCYAPPDKVKTRSRAWSLLSAPATSYPALSLERCQVCGRPEEALVEDATGDLACPACLKERQQKRGQVVDIHEVSNGGRAKVGFIFLTLKEPLYEQARAVAASLLSEFMDQRMVEPRILEPTRDGLFEYLQAIIAIGEFQAQVEQRLEGSRAYTLLRLPTKMVYLVHEDFYWRFLGFLNEERKQLRFPTTLRAVLCGPKTPFWSLMDGFLVYDPDKGDLYYDEAEGSIVMFVPQEVQAIRDLAGIAEREWRSSAQLIALSRFALTHNLAELLLEVDVRARQDKLPGRLVKPLSKALEGLETPDDENKARTKRAKLIDYIAKMARPPQGGGKGRR